MSNIAELTTAIAKLEREKIEAVVKAAARAMEVAGQERKGVSDNDVLVRQARSEAIRRAVTATIGDIERVPAWETNYLSSGLPMTTYIPSDKMAPFLPFVHPEGYGAPKAETPKVESSWCCCRKRKNL